MDGYYTNGKILTTDTTTAPWGDGSTVLTSLHTDGNLNEAHIVLTTSHVSKVTRPLGELDFLLSTANVDGGLSTGETIVKQTSSDPVLRLSNVDDSPSSMTGRYLLTNESDLVANYNTQNPGNKILTEDNCQGNTLASNDYLLTSASTNGKLNQANVVLTTNLLSKSSRPINANDLLLTTADTEKPYFSGNDYELVVQEVGDHDNTVARRSDVDNQLQTGEKILSTWATRPNFASYRDKLLSTADAPSLSTSTSTVMRLITFADLPDGYGSYKCCQVDKVDSTYYKNSYGLYFKVFTEEATCVISASSPTYPEIIIPKYVYTDDLIRRTVTAIEENSNKQIDFTSSKLSIVKKLSAPWFEGRVYGGIIFSEGLNIDLGMLTEMLRTQPIVQKIGASLTVSTSWRPISDDFEKDNYNSGFELNIRRYENTEENKTISFARGGWSAISDNIPHRARYNIDVELFDKTARASFIDAWGYESVELKNFELSIIP